MKFYIFTGLLSLIINATAWGNTALGYCQKFIIKMNVGDASEKADLVDAMEAISSAYNLKVVRLGSGPSLVVERVAGVMEEADDQDSLNKTFSQLSSLKGIKLFCDGTAQPHPRMTGSN